MLYEVITLVERWLGQKDVATLNELAHLSVEECEEQRPDMGAVHISYNFV